MKCGVMMQEEKGKPKPSALRWAAILGAMCMLHTNLPSNPASHESHFQLEEVVSPDSWTSQVTQDRYIGWPTMYQMPQGMACFWSDGLHASEGVGLHLTMSGDDFHSMSSHGCLFYRALIPSGTGIFEHRDEIHVFQSFRDKGQYTVEVAEFGSNCSPESVLYTTAVDILGLVGAQSVGEGIVLVRSDVDEEGQKLIQTLISPQGSERTSVFGIESLPTAYQQKGLLIPDGPGVQVIWAGVVEGTGSQQLTMTTLGDGDTCESTVLLEGERVCHGEDVRDNPMVFAAASTVPGQLTVAMFNAGGHGDSSTPEFDPLISRHTFHLTQTLRGGTDVRLSLIDVEILDSNRCAVLARERSNESPHSHPQVYIADLLSGELIPVIDEEHPQQEWTDLIVENGNVWVSYTTHVDNRGPGILLIHRDQGI